MKSYPNINMILTGKKLETLTKAAGIDVKMLQVYLHLSCPQPIYRWFKGQVLPSVDHLYALSRLLGLHMEELLVPQQTEPNIYWYSAAGRKDTEVRACVRILTYYEGLCRLSA